MKLLANVKSRYDCFLFFLLDSLADFLQRLFAINFFEFCIKPNG